MNLPIILLATSLLNTNIQFTKDSLYNNEKILTISVEEEEDLSKTLVLKEAYVFGYDIYDDPDTPYIDGVLVDGQYVYDWKISNFDDSMPHEISIKTVYSEGIDGTLAMAKNGDYSKIFSNPLVYIQIIYYIFSTIALFVSGLGLIKNKKKRDELENKIEQLIVNKVIEYQGDLKNFSQEFIEDVLVPTLKDLKSQNKDVIKSLILSRSDKPEDVAALLDVLNNASVEDVEKLSNTIKENLINTFKDKEKLKQNAIDTIKKIVTPAEEPKKDNYDGTSI